MAITMKKIGEIAGVSRATVSYVLNDKKDFRVSDTVRKKITELAKMLDYTPNYTAANLKKGRSGNFILIFEQTGSLLLSDPFNEEIFRGIRETLQKSGISFYLHCITDGNGKDIPLNNLKNSDAAIGISPVSAQAVNLVSGLKIPYMLIDPQLDNIGNNSVKIDNALGIRDLLNYLFSKNYRKIAFISGSYTAKKSGEPGSFRERRETFTKIMKAKNLPFYETVMERRHIEKEKSHLYISYNCGYNGAGEILKNKIRPEVIMCANDLIAFGVLNRLEKDRIRVPEDIAVTGFDNISLPGRFPESRFRELTTVDVPKYEMGKAAAERLMEASNSRDGNTHINNINMKCLLVKGKTG